MVPVTPEPFSIRLIEDNSQGVTLAVSGDLDLGTAATLRSAIDDHVGKPTVLDLSGVAFLDSTAMGTLLAARESAQVRGLAFRVRNLQTAPRAVLKMSGVYTLLVGDDPEE